MRTVKITAIVKDVSSEFWKGSPILHDVGVDNMDPREQLEYLEDWFAPKGGCERPRTSPIKIGDGSFRARMELHDIRKHPHTVTSTKGLRRGYVLMTFEVSQA